MKTPLLSLLDLESKQSAILWPVGLGEYHISCPAFQEAELLHKTFQRLGWYVCVAGCQSGDLEWNWVWVAGMDNKLNIQIKNGSKYNLDNRGLLKINVTEDDNGTEYRCNVIARYRKSSHIILLVLEPEQGKMDLTGFSVVLGIQHTFSIN